MPRHVRSVFLAAAVAVLAAGLTAPPAAAAPQTWTVNPGGTFTGTNNDGYTFRDDTQKMNITCGGSYSAAAVAFKSGSGLPSHIGEFKSLEFQECEGGIFPTVVPGHLPWVIRATAYDASTGEVTGRITGIHLVLTGSGCSAVIDGTAEDADNGYMHFSYYDNQTGIGTLEKPRGNLHLYDVTGSNCYSLTDGDQMAFFDGFALLNANQVSPVITSP